ncbi:helix-turn-helix transcriptional regulator [bacterium]|nr:helix-turn-helix transcriptional regulator [bacterium]
MSKVIGKRMREIRELKGMTQKQVADRCGMVDSAIRRYEAGGANPKAETLCRIAKALDVSITDLLNFSEKDKEAVINAEKMLSNIDGQTIVPGNVKETKMGDLSAEYNAVNEILSELILLPLAQEKAQEILEQNKPQTAQYHQLQIRKEKEKELNAIFNTLNEKGQQTAIERLKELAQIPEYQLKRRRKKQEG